MKSFVALFMGTMDPSRQMPDEATMAKGMAAWSQWMADHAAIITDSGGPLGKTKAIGPGGVSDTRNEVSGYVVLRAEDQQQAAELFINHPHFAIFPGDRVEVMEVLPIPSM